jgi:hypothetical protein
MTGTAAAQSALIVGATSRLGRELALQYAKSGWRVILAGRDLDELRAVSSDVAIRTGATVDTLPLDLVDTPSVERAAAAIRRNGMPQAAIFVAGLIEGFADAPYDAAIAHNIMVVNYAGPAQLVSLLLPALKSRGDSALAFVSSIAGERGRGANFVYGAAKAALNAYCQGLRAVLAPHRVRVLTVKLGYMDTRLAYGLAPPALTCSPHFAAKAIRRAIDRGSMVVYVPRFWRPICFLLRLIPERLFIRLPLP